VQKAHKNIRIRQHKYKIMMAQNNKKEKGTRNRNMRAQKYKRMRVQETET
jgi:hypothetical protein